MGANVRADVEHRHSGLRQPANRGPDVGLELLQVQGEIDQFAEVQLVARAIHVRLHHPAAHGPCVGGKSGLTHGAEGNRAVDDAGELEQGAVHGHG